MNDVMEGLAYRKERVIWNHDMERELIDLIRDRPYIWDTADPDFIKRSLKTRGYEEVADTMRSMTEQFIDGDTVRQKFCGIRSYFHRELRKIQSLHEREAGAEYQSKWEHFHTLQFLAPHIGIKKNVPASEVGVDSVNGDLDENPDGGAGSSEDMTIMVTPDDFNPDEPRSSPPLQMQEHQQVELQPAQTPRTVPPSQSSASLPQQRAMTSSRYSERLRLPFYKRKRLSETSLRYSHPKPRDGAEGYGDFVAGHLRTMTPQQQLICSNMINDCVRKVLSWSRSFDDVYYEINIKADS